MNNFRIAVIGLGYVGLPLALELSEVYSIVGFDVNLEKVEQLRHSIQKVGAGYAGKAVHFTADKQALEPCNVYIIAVPTPVHSDKTPDLRYMVSACEMVGKYMQKDDLVIFESTVYPGTTEEVCVPILEQASGLQLGEGFKVGYSPERINPGDTVHTLTTIIKVVSGSDTDALNRVDELYSSIIKAGTYRASSIRVAEAAKVIENSQRDINIAFMNELSMVFHKMGIDTNEVLEAASTKWNFLSFKPGLVGGHCISVDPYYFIYKAEQIGYQSQIITAGRKINDSISSFIVQHIIKQLMKRKESSAPARVGILGITFKENCADIRNTRVVDIIHELIEYGVEVVVYDPLTNPMEVWEMYGVKLASIDDFTGFDTIVVAVAHDMFKEQFSPFILKQQFNTDTPTLFDLKSLYEKEVLDAYGIDAWRL